MRRDVHAELADIFRPADEAVARAARRARVRSFALVGSRTPERDRKAARTGLIAATALAGLALGALVVSAPWKREAETVQLAAVAVPEVGAPIVPIVVAEAPQPQTTLLPAPTFTPQTAPPAKPQPRAVRPRPRPAVETASRTAPPGYPCGRLNRAAEARCAYPAVMAEDRRLRRAYAAATRAGVSRSTLVSYRSRWDSLRHRADDQPARVIVGYRRLADDLNRLAAGGRT